jgi:hypothetical protein
MDATPALGQLMGAYFHQDWDVEANDDRGIVDLFIRGEPALAVQLPAEIDRVLRELDSEDELRHYLLEELGSYYLADSDGNTYRTWLTRIAEQVRRSTQIE